MQIFVLKIEFLTVILIAFVHFASGCRVGDLYGLCGERRNHIAKIGCRLGSCLSDITFGIYVFYGVLLYFLFNLVFFFSGEAAVAHKLVAPGVYDDVRVFVGRFENLDFFRGEGDMQGVALPGDVKPLYVK